MPEQHDLPEPDRQERIGEILALLGGIAPAAVVANRDELFFRAGESSARGELEQSSLRRVVWPAVAATLAFVAAGLGYSLAIREREIIFVNRPAVTTGNTETQSVVPLIASEDAGQPQKVVQPNRVETIILPLPESDLIRRQDWAALSDAFAGQLRLQQERNRDARNATVASISVENDEALSVSPSRNRARTLLDLRNALRTM